jgi:hypothetical protein
MALNLKCATSTQSQPDMSPQLSQSTAVPKFTANRHEKYRYLESGQRRSEVRECCTRLLLPSMHALRDLTITPRPYSRCFHSREAHNDARATRTRSRGYEDNADMLSPLHSLANHWGRLRHFDQSVSHVVFLRPCPMPMLTHLTALSSAPSRYHLPPP